MKFEYVPSQVCSRHYTFDIDGDTIKSLQVVGGCNGNLKGISRIISKALKAYKLAQN